LIDGCAAVIGLLYPYLDDILGEKRGHKQEWSSVMRCIAVFVGINHASAVSFTNAAQVFSECYVTNAVLLRLLFVCPSLTQFNSE